MPRAETEGVFMTREDYDKVIAQLIGLVRERNTARRQLAAARKVGRFMCQTATDLADWIEEHAVRHDKREIADVRSDVTEILAALTPKRRRK